MDRYALFLDAGYLYAEGGKLCCGTPSRQDFMLDAENLNSMLRDLAHARCGLVALRTYWYDGARDDVKTATHQEIAALPNVKLRLGGINQQGQQKGVDALIYRDLMTLARERAISDAFVLAGDEDLLEGVRTAQDQGVRVTVIGIATPGGEYNQARELRFEADEVITLTLEALKPFFTVPSPSASPNDRGFEVREISEVGAAFARRWRERASENELRELIAGRPRIPPQLDIELLRHAETVLKLLLRDDEGAKHRLRRSFWDEMAGPHEI